MGRIPRWFVALLVLGSMATLMMRAVVQVSYIPSALKDNNIVYNFSWLGIDPNGTIDLARPTVNSIPSLVSFKHEKEAIEKCGALWKQPILVLATVPSAVHKAEERTLIRDTWASAKYYNSTRLRVVFMLGATEDEVLQRKVDKEVETYKDIVQSNFIDSYKNLTWKTTASLTWISKYCPDVPYIIKIDDDVSLNPFNLRKFLLEEIKKSHSSSVMYGRLMTKPVPRRNGKWKVSLVEYNETIYPPFLLGPAYIMERQAVEDVLSYMPHTPFLWLEDVYTTGFVSKLSNTKLVNLQKYHYVAGSVKRYSMQRTIFAFVGSKRVRDTLWHRIVSSQTRSRFREFLSALFTL